MSYPPQAKIEPQNLSGKAGYNVVVNQTETGYTTAAPSGGGGGVTDITYAALVTAIGASGLTAGAQYKITDYATVHYIVDASGTQYFGTIITGVNEPLIVTASSANTLEPVAYSALHPEDIIHYDFNPANWLDDVSFADLSGTPTIVTGFKGVIYFRHDTLLDNFCGYDFRNCKFRRWKTNAAAYNAGTTYAAGDIVVSSGFIYKSLQGANTGNTPAADSSFWVQLLDITVIEYWNANPDNINGILSGSEHFDFKTFAEGVNNTETYSFGCKQNHFVGFKDNVNIHDDYPTILQNNVFYLFPYPGFDFTIFKNSINAPTQNTIAPGFMNNTVDNEFSGNQLDQSFQYNNIEVLMEGNVIAKNCTNNTIASEVQANYIGEGAYRNHIGSKFLANTLGSGMAHNTFGSNFAKVTCKNNFQMNNSLDGWNLDLTETTDFTSATHVYGAYNTTIFKRVDGTAKLSYCDNSDVIQVVNANA